MGVKWPLVGANQSDRCPPYLSCRVSAPATISLAVVDISIILADCPLDDYHVLTACLTVSASDGLRLFSSVTETDPPPPSSCSANANTLYRLFPDPPPPPAPTTPHPQSLWLLLSCPSWRRFLHAHLPVSGD